MFSRAQWGGESTAQHRAERTCHSKSQSREQPTSERREKKRKKMANKNCVKPPPVRHRTTKGSKKGEGARHEGKRATRGAAVCLPCHPHPRPHTLPYSLSQRSWRAMSRSPTDGLILAIAWKARAGAAHSMGGRVMVFWKRGSKFKGSGGGGRGAVGQRPAKHSRARHYNPARRSPAREPPPPPLSQRTCKKSSCVTGSSIAAFDISRISAGVLPAILRRMPFIAASRQMLVMSSPL